MDTPTTTTLLLPLALPTLALGALLLLLVSNTLTPHLDPFHAHRTPESLGPWARRQPRFSRWRRPRLLLGPAVTASMAGGFCGANVVYISRIPLASPGRAGWSIILAMFNREAPPGWGDGEGDGGAVEKGGVGSKTSSSVVGSGEGAGTDEGRGSGGDGGGEAPTHNAGWTNVESKPLTLYQSHPCVVISRATLITMLVMSNARQVFQYSDASGFRGGYASYCGQWYITWPIGQEATVKFVAHDSLGDKEVFPRAFAQRADRCGQMISGVISSSDGSFALAFGGRLAPGTYVLRHAARGFQGAHSGRHLYNMLGGRAFEVGYLGARPASAEDADIDTDIAVPDDTWGREGSAETFAMGGGGDVRAYVPPLEAALLRRALDCLPWASVSWSAHRGLRDVLRGYGGRVMERLRPSLAAALRRTVEERAGAFRRRGWDPEFVRAGMGPMAAAAVLAGGGNSGDSVRVVTDVAAVYAGSGWDLARLDETRFWRRDASGMYSEHRDRGSVVDLDAEAVVALTKFFVLEWSQEFDYQLYHHFPTTLYFA